MMVDLNILCCWIIGLSLFFQITWWRVVSCRTERSLFALIHEMDAARVGCRWSLQARIAALTLEVKYKNKKNTSCELFVVRLADCKLWQNHILGTVLSFWLRGWCCCYKYVERSYLMLSFFVAMIKWVWVCSFLKAPYVSFYHPQSLTELSLLWSVA